MIIKGNNIIGNKILSIHDGEKLSLVKDLVYDPEVNRITALLVDKGNWFFDPKIIPLSEVKSIGNDVILVDSPYSIKRLKDPSSKMSQVTNDNTYLTKTKIISEEGKELGKVEDVYFESTTGIVNGLELSVEGSDQRRRIDISDILAVGKDATIVRVVNDSFEKIEHRDNLLQANTPSLTEHPEMANVPSPQLDNNDIDYSDTIKPVSPILGLEQKITQTAKNLASKMTGKSDKKEVVNTTPPAQHPVENPDLMVADKKPDYLKDDTQPIITNLESTPKSEEVYEKLKEHTLTHPRVPGDYSRYESISYNQIRPTKEDLKRKEAVGQYLTKTILDFNDNTIAKRGELITHKLLDKAEEEGVLDQILSHTSLEPV